MVFETAVFEYCGLESVAFEYCGFSVPDFLVLLFLRLRFWDCGFWDWGFWVLLVLSTIVYIELVLFFFGWGGLEFFFFWGYQMIYESTTDIMSGFQNIRKTVFVSIYEIRKTLKFWNLYKKNYQFFCEKSWLRNIARKKNTENFAKFSHEKRDFVC